MAVTITVTYLYWILYDKPVIGTDDANIYFKYIKNFAEGEGFVYNPGSQKVEGFTSFFWVLLITPLYFLPRFEGMVLVLNVVLTSAVFYKSIRFVNHLTHQRYFFSAPALLFLAITCLIPGYIEWAILSLMETGLWSFLLVSIVICICHEKLEERKFEFGVLLMLLAVTRPESILIGMVFLLLYSFRLFMQYKKLSTCIFAVPATMFALTFVLLVTFRLMYFGYPLPNTYYAKVSGDTIYNLIEGVRYYLISSFQSPVLPFITGLVVLSVMLLTARHFRRSLDVNAPYISTQIVLLAVTLASFGISVYVGGDHFKLLRLHQPFFPIYLFILFNVSFWRDIFETRSTFNCSRLTATVLVLGFIPFIYCLTATPLHTFRKHKSPVSWEFRLAELGRDEGMAMNTLFQNMPKLPSVGVSAAGGISWSYRGEIIDLMGLNNSEMAHSLEIKVGLKNHAAFDKMVFYRQAPDLFHGYFRISKFLESVSDTSLFENSSTFKGSFTDNLYKGIFSERQFLETYVPVIISSEKQGQHLKTYCKRTYVPELERNGLTVKLLSRASERATIVSNVESN